MEVTFNQARMQRKALIDRAQKQLTDIEDFIIEIECWNKNNPNEVPIDADPDGQLGKLMNGLRKMLGLR